MDNGSARSFTPLPRELLELKPKAIEAIETKQTDSLREVLDQLRQAGVFFHIQHWHELLGVLDDGDSLKILWEFSEPHRGAFRADDLLARFALTAERFDDPELLLEIVRDIKARAGNDRLQYQRFWKGCRDHYSGSRGTPHEVYVRFARLGLVLEDSMLLQESLANPSYAEIFIPKDGWNILATEALASPNHRIARILWDTTVPSRRFLTHYEFGLFAELAVVLGDVELFAAVLDVVDERKMFLSREIWNRLLQVAVQYPDSSLVKAMWERCEQSRRFLTAWDFSHFAMLAADLNEPEMLEVVFDGWTPEGDTLLAGEHATWGTFLKAAEELSCDDLILRILCRLEMYFDPVRHHDRGTIQQLMFAIQSRTKNLKLAKEIGLLLRGDHWTIRQFLIALRAYRPQPPGKKGGAFGGACRRIMKRLINSYAGHAPERFEDTLATVVDGVMELKGVREEAFFAIISRGHENFAGNLQSLLREAYLSNLAFVEDLSDDEIIEQIAEIGHALARFEKAAEALLPQPYDFPNLPPGAETLISVIETSQANHLQGVPRDDADAWQQMRSAFERLEVGSYGASEWSSIFKVLIATVFDKLAPIVRQQFKIAAHRIKDDFLRDFADPLKSGTLTDEQRRSIAGEIRMFLGSSRAALRRQPLGKEIPFNIEAATRRVFFGRKGPGSDGEFRLEDGSKWIAGREGIRGAVIEPLFAEIVENCRRSFEALGEGSKVFEATLVKGRDRDEGFILLTVVNSRPLERMIYPRSTNLGLGAIQGLARTIQHGGRHGDARFDPEGFLENSSEPVFRTTVLFPAWTGQVPMNEGDDDEI